MSQLKKGVLFSYINIFITNITGLVITPLIIAALGNSEYGLYTLIGAFVGYISILDLGLNNTVIRYVSQHRIENKKKEEENFLATVFIIYLIIGLLIAVAGYFFYIKIEDVFGNSLTPEQLEKAKVMTIFYIANIAISLPGGTFSGICFAYERFFFPKLWAIVVKQILRTIAILCILYYGTNAIGIVILDSVVNLLFIAGTVVYTFYVLKVKVRLHDFKFHYFKTIFQYSLWIFIFGIVFQFQWSAGQVVLGINHNTKIVAVYAVGIMLGIYFRTFGNVINSFILPTAVKSVSNQLSNDELSQQMIKVARVILIGLLYILGAFILYGHDFIILWIGYSYIDSWFIALLVMAVNIIPISQGYANTILEASNKVMFKALLFLVLSVLGVVLGYFLSIDYAGKGMIIGTTVMIGVSQIVMSIYYQKNLGLNMIRYFQRALLPLLFGALIAVFPNYLIRHFMKSQNWGNFILQCTLYTVAYGTVLFFFMNPFEKQLFKVIKK